MKEKKPTYPSAYIFWGVVNQLFGGVFIVTGLVVDIVGLILLGSVIASIGTLILQVGIVGQGALVALRAVRSES